MKLTWPAHHTRAAIGALVTLHTRARHTHTSSNDKRPHFSSHGKREGESERKMEVRRERRERRDRERERKTEGGREEGTCPFPPFSSSTHRITQALTALHKHAWIPTLPAGEEELLGQGEHKTLPATSLYVPVHQRTVSRVVRTYCLSCAMK